MKSCFQTRDYPKHLEQKELSKLRFNKQNNNNNESKFKRVTFAVTYHPYLKSLLNLVKKHLNSSSRKTNSYLGTANLYPQGRLTGSC